MLAVGLSQTTTNLIASCLNVHPRLVMPEQYTQAYRSYYAPPSSASATSTPAPNVTVTSSTPCLAAVADFADVKDDDELAAVNSDWSAVSTSGLFMQ